MTACRPSSGSWSLKLDAEPTSVAGDLSWTVKLPCEIVCDVAVRTACRVNLARGETGLSGNALTAATHGRTQHTDAPEPAVVPRVASAPDPGATRPRVTAVAAVARLTPA